MRLSFDYTPEDIILHSLEKTYPYLKFLSEYDIANMRLFIVVIKSHKVIIKTRLEHYELRETEKCVEKVVKEIEKFLNPQPIQGKYVLLRCQCCNAIMTNLKHCDYCGANYTLI